MDPPDRLLRLAVEAGCVFAIDTDAHAPGQLDWLGNGTGRAGQAGISADRVINARGAVRWQLAGPVAADQPDRGVGGQLAARDAVLVRMTVPPGSGTGPGPKLVTQRQPPGRTKCSTWPSVPGIHSMFSVVCSWCRQSRALR